MHSLYEGLISYFIAVLLYCTAGVQVFGLQMMNHHHVPPPRQM